MDTACRTVSWVPASVSTSAPGFKLVGRHSDHDGGNPLGARRIHGRAERPLVHQRVVRPLVRLPHIGSGLAAHHRAGASEVREGPLDERPPLRGEGHRERAGAIGPDGPEPRGPLPLLMLLAILTLVRAQLGNATRSLRAQV